MSARINASAIGAVPCDTIAVTRDNRSIRASAASGRRKRSATTFSVVVEHCRRCLTFAATGSGVFHLRSLASTRSYAIAPPVAR